MTEFVPTRMIRARKSHAQKTRADSRAATMIAAMFGKGPTFCEDEDGNCIRDWKPCELQRYTNSDIALALANRVAVTDSEMLDIIPPSAIRYCVTKQWLRPHGNNGLY